MGISFSVSASGSDLLTACCGCLVKPVQYICELEEKLEALGTKMEEVSNLKNDVEERVKIVERQKMKELDEIKKWVTKVDATKALVSKLRDDATREIERNFLSVCCPWNWKSSYRRGEEVARKKDDVTTLYEEGQLFKAAADRLISFPVDERPGVSTVGLESTFEEVWGYIEDQQVGILGLWGMGGIGKTALLIEINKELCNPTHGFNPVIWVTVSRNPDPVSENPDPLKVSENPDTLKVQKLQIEIGKNIGFDYDKWKIKTQQEKATDIYNVLNKKKFVLLLDDIWERIDLQKVGIPLPNNQNGSKVVFTTRSEDVCGLMEAKPIKMKLLEAGQALVLFKEKVTEDTINAHSKIPKLAEIVAAKCGGLPLALITIGRAMACKKTPQQWRDAIEDLKKYPADFPGMGKEVFPPLKFSYDSLSSTNNERSCFLYCSLFPEDYLISKQTLIEYWIGEGFLDGDNDFNRPQRKGRQIIDTLIHACLLEEFSSDEVKMHDMIRDMALWIARDIEEVEDKFLVRVVAGLKKAPEVEKWTGINRMSLMFNHIEKLEETPSNGNLSTLLLNNNNLEMVTPGFFQHMGDLRVLDLSHNFQLSHNFFLPKLPSQNFELVSLRYLNLSYTKISELPMEFENFIELKYLGLESTYTLRKIPQGVLSSLKKLLVLKMERCGSSDLFAEEGSVLSGGHETLVEELKCLENLNQLGITIKSASALSRLFRSSKLQSSTTSLSLWSLTDSKLDMSFLERMGCLNELEFKECMSLEDLTIESAGQGMPNSEIISHPSFDSLRFVYIWTCPLLKEVTRLVFAPNLEILSITKCESMEEVIRGGQGGGDLSLFAKLKSLDLTTLPQLTSIYPNALTFPCLDSLSVHYCPNLKKLPLNSESAKGRRVAIKGHEEWWSALKWVDEDTRKAFHKSFRLSKDTFHSVRDIWFLEILMKPQDDL